MVSCRRLRSITTTCRVHTHLSRSLMFWQRERERKFNLSIQPALAYEDVSMLESSAKLRMAAKQ